MLRGSVRAVPDAEQVVRDGDGQMTAIAFHRTGLLAGSCLPGDSPLDTAGLPAAG